MKKSRAQTTKIKYDKSKIVDIFLVPYLIKKYIFEWNFQTINILRSGFISIQLSRATLSFLSVFTYSFWELEAVHHNNTLYIYQFTHTEKYSVQYIYLLSICVVAVYLDAYVQRQKCVRWIVFLSCLYLLFSLLVVKYYYYHHFLHPFVHCITDCCWSCESPPWACSLA